MPSADTASSIPEAWLQAVRDAVRLEIEPRFDDLHRFVDRRIAEVSAEVHGAVQLVDYSESNLSGQLGMIHEQIARMVSLPSEETRTSGVELEAVIQATEAAANQIMEAAEAISDFVRVGANNPDALRAIAGKVESIFEACSFQDLTGQRVRRAIQHLQHVEEVLAVLADPAKPPPIEPLGPPQPTVVSDGHDMGQSEIDRLLADF
jgi:chemotaxis protein CheZ